MPVSLSTAQYLPVSLSTARYPPSQQCAVVCSSTSQQPLLTTTSHDEERMPSATLKTPMHTHSHTYTGHKHLQQEKSVALLAVARCCHNEHTTIATQVLAAWQHHAQLISTLWGDRVQRSETTRETIAPGILTAKKRARSAHASNPAS